MQNGSKHSETEYYTDMRFGSNILKGDNVGEFFKYRRQMYVC